MSTKHTNHKHAGGDAQPPSGEAPAAAAAAGPVAALPEADVLKDRLLRLQADFDNFRRRSQRDRAELASLANENIMRELLPVLDHFEIGLKVCAEHQTDKAVHDGFHMVHDQLRSALRKSGLEALDVHEAGFDPHLHEAVAHIPSDEYPADQIISQTRRGYRLGEKLLRPIQVVVSSGPGAPAPDGEEKATPVDRANGEAGS
jgi:molecular chaperone GrpE